MENEQLENETPENEPEVVEPESTEEPEAEEQPEVEEAPKDDSDLKSALAQKEHFRNKLKEAEAKLARANKDSVSTALDVEDYIDISTSLGGLDPVEQAYLARQHKLTGESMKDIRESEDFQLWDSAYQQKKEKEQALKPNATQENEDAPKSVVEKLRNKTVAEKEQLLKEFGLYKENKPRNQSANIGDKINPVI